MHKKLRRMFDGTGKVLSDYMEKNGGNTQDAINHVVHQGGQLLRVFVTKLAKNQAEIKRDIMASIEGLWGEMVELGDAAKLSSDDAADILDNIDKLLKS